MGDENEVTVDLTQLSDADLNFYSQGNVGAISNDGLLVLQGRKPEALIPKMFDATVSGVKEVSRDVSDWARGKNIQYPQLPILGQGVSVNQLGLTPRRAAALLGLVTTTLDDTRLEAGIKNIVPDAQVMPDKFGNIIASIPIKDAKGNLLRYETFYPNPRGPDVPTATQAAGAVAFAPLIESGLAAIGLPSTGVLGGTALAGTEAAISEGISSTTAGQDFDISQPLYGMGFGGIFGIGAKVVTGVGGFILDKFRKAPLTVIDRDGMLQPSAIRYLKGQGIDPDTIQASIFEDLKKLLDSGVSADEAVRKASAAGLPVPIPLTSGQISGNAEQQLFEDMASKGVYGEDAARFINDSYTVQQEAVKANIPEIQKIIGGNLGTTARTEGGQRVQAALAKAREAAQKAANALYTEARTAGAAYLDPTVASTFGDELVNTIRQNYHPDSIPITQKLIAELDDGFKTGVSIEAIQVIRTKLTNVANNPGPDASAAGRVIGILDQKLEDMADTNLLYGDPATVGRWANAIKNYRGFKNTWSGDGILNRLTREATIDGVRSFVVAPEAAAKTILGASFSGLINNPSTIRILQTLKKQLPGVEWDMLREEAFMLISDGIVSASTGKAANTFSKEWFDANRKNSKMLAVLFTPEERRVMSALATTTSQITRTAKNTSNSAAAAGSLLGKLAGMLGSSDAGRFASRMWFMSTLQKGYGYARARAAAEGRTTARNTDLDRLIIGGGAGFGMTDDAEQPEEPVQPIPTAPPQARVQPTASPAARGLPFMTNQQAAAPAPQPAPAPVSPQSRQMLQQLFPNDAILQAAQQPV
jgi:hypothetical protein